MLDGRGERAKLKRCRSCGIMHRADGQCHWCGEVKRGLPLPSVNVLKSAAAIALMLTAAGGVWRYAPELRDVAATVQESMATSATVNPSSAVRDVASGAGVITQQTTAPVVQLPMAAPAIDSAAIDAAPRDEDMAGAANDIRWVPAVARTWVNVRSDASRGGEVVGVIKPASRAMLGTDRAGWRQVRSPDVSGWVDPRLFEADSLRTRGE
jgi:hypothetical protein